MKVGVRIPLDKFAEIDMAGMDTHQEILRLQQLQLMGITSYFPRFALPGALPSESRSWEAADEPAITPELVEHKPAEHKPAEPKRADIKQDAFQVPQWRHAEDVAAKERIAKEPALGKAAITTQQSRSRKETLHDENTDDALSLHLLLIPVDQGLCVLNQIPVLGKSQLQEKQQKLLDNILFFLGTPTAAYHSVRTFHWPLPGMSDITSGHAAKSSLMHFLEQFSQEQPFSNLLVMGEQGAGWMREADTKEADTAFAPRPWQTVHTYSLDQMLTLPSIKREVWQHLLPLQARLKQA
jgi:hypothetical protein